MDEIKVEVWFSKWELIDEINWAVYTVHFTPSESITGVTRDNQEYFDIYLSPGMNLKEELNKLYYQFKESLKYRKVTEFVFGPFGMVSKKDLPLDQASVKQIEDYARGLGSY